MRGAYVLGAAVVLACGCGSGGGDSSGAREEGIDITKNPLEALKLQNMEPVEPVHFSKLIEALPDVPSGWNATDPGGSNLQKGAMQTSTAKREYREEGTGKQVTVEIDDLAFYRTFYVGFFMAAKFSEETTEGYEKGITVGEWPGFESYVYQRKVGRRTTLVHKRYSIKVEIINAEATEFDTWLNRVKIDKLPKQ